MIHVFYLVRIREIVIIIADDMRMLTVPRVWQVLGAT